MIGGITYVPVRWVFTRAWTAPVWGLVMVCVLAYARLRGAGNIVLPQRLTREVAWNRFWYDNDRPRRAPYSESEEPAAEAAAAAQA
jgi:hypothetical protein